VDLDNWNLTVSGAVQKPGDYTLAQIQTLPKFRQNTRHVCIEGWDVIGRFGGARLADFLQMIGADPAARLSPSNVRMITTIAGYGTARHPQSLLCYENVRSAAHA